MPSASSLFLASVSALLIMGPAGYFLHRAFLARLRTKHPGTWSSLGRPTAVWSGSVTAAFAVNRFIRKREYTRLEDEPLTKLCDFYRAYAIGYSLMFVVLLAATVWVVLAGPEERLITIPIRYPLQAV